jgi:hypothetical protein
MHSDPPKTGKYNGNGDDEETAPPASDPGDYTPPPDLDIPGESEGLENQELL